MHLKIILFAFFFFNVICIHAQNLIAGFSKDEYAELMAVSAHFGESAYYTALPAPKRFKEIYLSPVMGLQNRWSLWSDGKGTAVISIRGTVGNPVSWLENFYAAMVPAKGSMQLSKGNMFDYNLSNDPKAAVHVGWLLATGFLAQDILPRIDSMQRGGTQNFYVTGHSQGGAIAYLLTAYLYHLQQSKKLPATVRFKTYCSAAPKPGNLYFAYDYQAATQGGWSYTVVNSADWVPESPVSVQTLQDFNENNPLKNADAIIGKQGFIERIALRHAYNKLSKPTNKAQKAYERYLGRFAARQV